MNSRYRIPILSVQDKLLYMDTNKNVLALKKFCRENIHERENFYVEYNLERQWYPEVVTTDRWLAWKLIQKYGGNNG